MAKPSADSIARDITTLKESGISNVVSLLQATESSQLGLSSEEEECSAQGLTFSRLPIKDYGVPQQAQLYPFIESLYANICNGASTVVHCRGGIGRTGLVCSCLLIMDGFSAENAISLISKKRGETVPETSEQIATIMSFYNHRVSTQA